MDIIMSLLALAWLILVARHMYRAFTDSGGQARGRYPLRNAFHPPTPWSHRSRRADCGMVAELPVKTEQDVARALSVPYDPPSPGADKRPAAVVGAPTAEAMGERGLVLLDFADPIGEVHRLLGSSLPAEWSITNRDLVVRLVRVAAERLEDMLRRRLADPRVVEPVAV
jgi:hypothetical protein